ncbi:peptidoglycan DD-metalloendopeptidase family protein (plasmid) [Lactobacillus sp. PV037]|uniref:phage tail tip lysozyme n=1 Tax=Lactobacillus sp. PV037 TaxID=2594496 RepID=UPI00223EA137|nr:phage tail tip lysozyme [Lactobacillus sp. PV037]QNQ82998.1 peptidoglycan DD-metalloendopeptidase family protein [Lactobacillus sp. PV037]
MNLFKRNKHIRPIFLVIGGAFLLIILLVTLIGGGLQELESEQEASQCLSEDDSGPNVGSKKVTGSNGGWTKKGTRAYKTAKQVFDYWVKYGMSGAQTSGIIGNIAIEDPNFVLDQKEIGGGPNGGGGLYQFTPWTKYKNGSDGSWSVKSQSDFILKSEPQTVAAFRRATKNGTPEHAAERWEMLYERPRTPGATLSTRQSSARTAYKLFGGAKIKGKNSTLSDAAKGADKALQESQSDCDDDDIPSSGNWGWPFKGMTYSYARAHSTGVQAFGYTRPSFHDGEDLGTVPYNNQTIHAIHGGKVTKIGHQGSTNNDLGWYVWVTSSDGWHEIYQEFGFTDDDKKYIKVKVNQKVKTGTPIGYLTQHGIVNHLHLGTTKKDFNNAVGNSFSPAGGWKDPFNVIKNGMASDKKSSKTNDKKSDSKTKNKKTDGKNK